MNITTDPAVPTEVEVRRLWVDNNNSISQITYFLEQVFKCDHLTAETVASCVFRANEDLNNCVENTISDVIAKLSDLRDLL